ncbi:MAG: hypothetical protein ABW128_07050 [Rhizorhabdus sp.]
MTLATLAYAPFIIGGIAAVATIAIEIRRALHPGSAVRELHRRVAVEPRHRFTAQGTFYLHDDD